MTIDQGRDNPNPAEPMRAEEFDKRLIERLTAYKSRFEEVRKIMGVDDTVGLATLPKAHPGLTMAVLSKVKFIDGGWDYKVLAGVMGTDSMFIELPFQETRRVISEPNREKSPLYVVTLYQKGGPEYEEPEPRLLQVPDDILDALNAHEMAHWVVEKAENPLPPHIQAVLDKRERDLNEFYRNRRDNLPTEVHSLNHRTLKEADIDIIVALSGFKDAIISQLDYVIECAESYEEKSHAMFYSVQEIVQEIKYRKNQVLKYAGRG